LRRRPCRRGADLHPPGPHANRDHSHAVRHAGWPGPVVVGLYGHGGTIEKLRNSLHLDATADREHFLAAYPDAVDHDWSYGRPIVNPMPAANGEPVDDVGFVRLIIDKLIETKRADPARIYVTGASRGGLMTYTLACALADRIAAAAPAITGITEYQRDDCRPTRPVPLMVIAGTNDVTQMYDGWLGPRGRLLSVPETLEYWRKHNGCSKQDIRDLPHRNGSDGTRVWIISWTDCSDGVRMWFYRINAGGHQLPSLAPDSEKESKRSGLRNRDFEAADEIWSFVKAFSR
jgi:polyhydroxybutyrate depolymerase